MPTILDVAREAGVSQGTASNVLNGKGNVSSEKIKSVQEAAQKLGYTMNERAKTLRKGRGNIICVIIPSIECKQYRELYYSIKSFSEKNNYVAELLLSDDNPQVEMELIQRAKSMMAAGVATVTCLNQKKYNKAYYGLEKVCFVERKPVDGGEYFGFHYEKAGKKIAEYIVKNNYHHIAVITDSLEYSNEREFFLGMKVVLSKKLKVKIYQISTGLNRISHTLLNSILLDGEYDAIITSNIAFAEKVKGILDTFDRERKTCILTLSPVVTLPERNFVKYELNYSLLGRKVADKILNSPVKDFVMEDHLVENDGNRNWKKIELKNAPSKCLNVITLEGPEASIMQGLAKLYTEETGTEVKVSVFSYNDIYDQFSNVEFSNIYDVFRVDVTWLSWFAQRLLVPLEEVYSDMAQLFEGYIQPLIKKYSYVRGKAYALPFTPSVQLLFYRRDLFENTVYKRMFRESYKRELRIPENFEEYNQIAEFFAKGLEPDVSYHSCLTLGNTGVASSEFLARIFSHKKNLFDENGRIVVDDEAGKKALHELIIAQRYANKTTSHWWNESAQRFANGEFVMMINFSNYASEILGTNTKVAGNIGFAMVPGDNPMYGGGALGISQNSKKKEDAAAFIKWITKEPVASGMAALGSVSPCIKTYNKYDIINTFPWLELSEQCFKRSHTERVSEAYDKPFDEKTFLNIIGTAVKSVLMGSMSEENALNKAQQMIEREL